VRFLVLTSVWLCNCSKYYDPCGGHRKVPIWEGAKRNEVIEKKVKTVDKKVQLCNIIKIVYLNMYVDISC